MEKFNKNFLITGGTEGLGRHTIDQFISLSSDDDRLLTCSRNSDKNKQLSCLSDKIDTQNVDLGDMDSVDALIKKAEGVKIDTLVLNAAVVGHPDIDEKKYSEEYVREVNEKSTIRIIEKLLPTLREKESLVVFMSSPMARGVNFLDETNLYAQTKVNVEKNIKDLSGDPKNKNISFLIIHPGHFNSRLHKNVISNVDKDSAVYKRTARLIEDNQLRDPAVMGKILYSISNSRKLFNPSTKKYDIPISSGQVYDITDEEYKSNK